MFTPKIATHWTPESAQATFDIIANKVREMTEDQVADEIQMLMAEAEKAYSRVKCWSEKMWDKHDINRLFKEEGDTYSEMAAIWCMVS